MQHRPRPTKERAEQKIRAASGNMRRAALLLGCSRYQLYYLVWQYGLKGFVAEVRAASKNPDWLKQAGKELLRDG